MSYNKVKWFSFPFVAPKGKGSKPEPPQGDIEEIDPPTESLPRHRADDPFRLTPERRRQRIIELLVIAFWRWLAKQQEAKK